MQKALEQVNRRLGGLAQIQAKLIKACSHYLQLTSRIVDSLVEDFYPQVV